MADDGTESVCRYLGSLSRGKFLVLSTKKIIYIQLSEPDVVQVECNVEGVGSCEGRHSGP